MRDFLDAFPCFSSLLSLPVHELGPENSLGFVLIVRSAAKPQVVDGGPPTSRDRLDVIELQAFSLRAPVASFTHEGALAGVALPNDPSDVEGNVPSVR